MILIQSILGIELLKNKSLFSQFFKINCATHGCYAGKRPKTDMLKIFCDRILCPSTRIFYLLNGEEVSIFWNAQFDNMGGIRVNNFCVNKKSGVFNVLNLNPFIAESLRLLREEHPRKRIYAAFSVESPIAPILINIHNFNVIRFGFFHEVPLLEADHCSEIMKKEMHKHNIVQMFQTFLAGKTNWVDLPFSECEYYSFTQPNNPDGMIWLNFALEMNEKCKSIFEKGYTIIRYFLYREEIHCIFGKFTI